mmetsp:Transcript_14362/g.28887  ORF Transcript_14362/g.28887 Transcript_14362/m.28887 type:complete len:172 (-) Transcript_14362:2781-3296(-)
MDAHIASQPQSTNQADNHHPHPCPQRGLPFIACSSTPPVMKEGAPLVRDEAGYEKITPPFFKMKNPCSKSTHSLTQIRHSPHVQSLPPLSLGVRSAINMPDRCVRQSTLDEPVKATAPKPPSPNLYPFPRTQTSTTIKSPILDFKEERTRQTVPLPSPPLQGWLTGRSKRE